MAGAAALGVEAVAVVVITFGAVEAVVRLLSSAAHRTSSSMERRTLWLKFARWLLLGLEFALAADIIRSTMSPTWDDLGQLATIAGIRTVLAYFLERDIRELHEAEVPGNAVAVRPGAAPRRGAVA